MGQVSDEQLLTAYRNGQTSALDRLLERYQDRVLQFVRWRTALSPQEAEDVAQDVFLQVFRSAENFAGRSRFRTWLYGVATHVCNHAIRTRARRRDAMAGNAEEMATAIAVPDTRSGILDSLVAEERRHAVRTAVMELDTNQRVVLLLRDWEDLSYSEIAEVLQIPEGTIKSRAYYARLQLAKVLRPVLEEKVES